MSIPQFKRRTVLKGALFASALAYFLQGQPPAALAALPDWDVPSDLAGLDAYLAQAEPPIYIFEGELPSTLSATASTIEISDKHGKVGPHSLKWDYQDGAKLELNAPLKVNVKKYNPNTQNISAWVPQFCFWVYNESAKDASLRVEFCTDDKVDCWFDFRLNFTGWRTCWVRFGYDTEGAPTATMNRIRMIPPAGEGTLWIDQIVTNLDQRGDHAAPDWQVPKVQPYVQQGSNYHWLGSIYYWQMLEDLDKSAPSAEELQALDKVRSYLLEDHRIDADLSESGLSGLEGDLENLGIPELAEMVAGQPPRPAVSGPFTNHNQMDVFPGKVRGPLMKAIGAVKTRDVMDLAGKCAKAWDSANRAGNADAAERAGKCYVRVMAYLFDQGWAAGSSQGSHHHYGYVFREWVVSIMLAKELLRQNNMWEDAYAALTWWAGTGRLTQPFEGGEAYSGLVDVLNTLLNALLISSAISDDDTEAVARLRAFGNWINSSTEYSPGTLGGLKPGGTLFHHMWVYLAYGRDALAGAIPVLTRVNATVFGLVGDQANTLREALFAQARLCNTYEFPIALSGRHPTGLDGISDGLLKYRNIDLYALVGKRPFFSGDNYDREMAATFLRLMPPEPTAQQIAWAEEFKSAGIEPEVGPEGYWQYQYAPVAQSRQAKWSVTVTGHNRYGWTAEIYKGENLYGRYLSYGAIEIQAVSDSDGVVTHQANGWVQPGIDWRRVPGATTIQIPIEKLRVDIGKRSSVMPMVWPAFGGGGAMAGHAALFGMQLAEHPGLNGSHRTLLSAFLVGDRVIALGSAISNDDTTNPTYTTLFQMIPSVMTDAQPTQSGKNWLVDPAGNGFVVLEGTMKTESIEQTMSDQADKESATHTVEHGWIDHGTAPKDSGYAYVTLVQGGKEATEAYAETPTVKILQRDNTAHVVTDEPSHITAYTVFDADAQIVEGVRVRSASRPILVLERAIDDKQVAFSVTDPDLHLFEGRDEDQWDGDTYVGNQGPYQRPWRFNSSLKTSTELLLEGKWTLVAESAQRSAVPVEVAISGEFTTVTVTSSDAASVEFTLVPEGVEPDPTQTVQPTPTETPTGEPSQTPQPTPSGTPTDGAAPSPTDRPTPSAAPQPSGTVAPVKPTSPTGGGTGNTLPVTGASIGAAVLGAGVAGTAGVAAYRLRNHLANGDDIGSTYETKDQPNTD